jgi:hypothetical protein
MDGEQRFSAKSLRAIRSLLIALFVLAGDRGSADTDQGVVVGLANYAGVEAGPLADAVRVATSVLGQAGVRTQWRDCTAVRGHLPCEDGARSQAVLAIKLFGRGQSRAQAPSSDALGVALLPKREGERLVAIVFVEESRVQARRSSVPLHVVLGHVMAHEAGHLLLGAPDHAAAGLMQARWSSRDLARAEQGQFRFSEQESSRLRAAVLRLVHPLAAGDDSHLAAK